MRNNKIVIKGAKENNLKNIDLEIPRDKLIIMTGLSGSGKTSLAFDTIYAEGQRRYVEVFRHMRVSFLEIWKSQMLNSLKGYHHLSQLIKKQHPITRVQPSVL